MFVESPGSLTFEVQDVPAIAAVAHARGALVVMDNTWATPLFFRAFDHGVDVSVHAATKYIGGHSDVLLGLIVAQRGDVSGAAPPVDRHGRHRVERRLLPRPARPAHARHAARPAAGERDEDRAVAARAAGGQGSAASGLPGARGHELWKRDFRGATSLFGVVLHPVAQTRIAAMLDGLELFSMGWSWGGFESLIIPTYPERSRTVTTWAPAGRACGSRSASRIRTT